MIILIISTVLSQAAFASGTMESMESAKTYSYELISKVAEDNTRVVAVAIDFEKPLDIAWELAHYFKVSAELLPVETYTGDLIANSAVPMAERNITRAYTSDVPEIGSPKAGQYVIIELNPTDVNNASYYKGFNPGIRQLIPYGKNMKYEIELVSDLNYYSPNISPAIPGSEIETISKYSNFVMSGHSIMTADEFSIGSFTLDSNETIKSMGYNFYAPEDFEPGQKVPLVVFLHGSGQSHDYTNFADDLLADIRSPLLVYNGGTTWIENMKEKCYVLVPQIPARDTKDARGEIGWNNIETQNLVMALVDRIIAENDAIDTDRLYLTGLSMGAFGSWGILTSDNDKVSDKFAAGVLIAGGNGFTDFYRGGISFQEFYEKQLNTNSFKAENVKVPIWICGADTDPLVPIINSRSPFAILSGSRINNEGEVVPSPAISFEEKEFEKYYEGTNVYDGSEIRYSEYLFGDGSKFLDLGMIQRNGHQSSHITYKDQRVLDWMFAQHK